MSSKWYDFAESKETPSPALIIYPQRVAENIRDMISIAGYPTRLRPHVKTHKLPEIVRMQMESGIQKFKCSTIAEAEMLAGCGANDVLLAYQPVGPNIRRIVQLAKNHPTTEFSVIVDDIDTVRDISDRCVASIVSLELFIDLDVGMHRSGTSPGSAAVELARMINKLSGITMGGFHVYDGHIVASSIDERRRECRHAMEPVLTLRSDMRQMGLEVPRIVAGGTSTFPIHAESADIECSPGTCLLWDFGHGDRYLDLPFLQAASLMTRVVSFPASGRMCLDLGHKAVAAEKPPPHVRFLDLPDAEQILHSEEHLVIKTERANEFRVGDLLFGIPVHICPTCALYGEAIVVEDGHAVDRWSVVARKRCLTV